MHVEITEVRRQLPGHWPAVLATLAPALGPALARPGRHGPCPVHGGKDGFRLFKDVAGTGGGICATCGAFADGFALLMWLHGWRFGEALAAVAGVLGAPAGPCPPARRPPRPAPGEADPAAVRSARVWAESLAPTDARAGPLARYLAGRGLDPQGLDPAVVRFHPALGYWADGRLVAHYPALLLQVTDRDGVPVTVHRTYLDPRGGKAPVPAPRKLMRYPAARLLAGGAIRLTPVAPVLGLCEGFETAWTVRRATGMAVWSAVSAGLLARFEPPRSVRRLVLWADRDRSGAGERAAASLRDRLLARGVAVRIEVPPGPLPAAAKGRDWADVWCASGARGFPPRRAPRAPA